MGDLISIIVPIYNAERYLSICIESIINQSFTNLEIILVNDGSTDRSLEICNYYKKRDARIVVINKKNEGVSIARNTGIKHARGKYIGFIDSDDWIDVNMYKKMHKAIDKYSVDLVMCKYFRVDEYDNKHIVEEPLKYGYLNKEDTLSSLILPMIGSTLTELSAPQIMGNNWRCLYKKDAIDKYKLEFKSIKIAEDMLFHLSYIGRCDSVYIINEALYYYRYNSISATSNYITDLWGTLNKQLKLVEEELIKMNLLDDKSRERLLSSRLYFICWCMLNELHKNNKNTYSQKIKNMKFYTRNKYSKEVFTFKNIMRMNLKERCIYLCVKLGFYKIYYMYITQKRNISR